MSRSRFFRGLGAVATATAAICACCALVSLETVWAGLFIVPLVVPSVVLFVLLEGRGPRRLFAYLGFGLPIAVLVGICWFEARRVGFQPLQDGSQEALTYVIEILSVGVVAALAFLDISSKRGRA